MLVLGELILKSPSWCFPVVELQPANVELGTVHLLKEKAFVTGLPLCQQGRESGQAGDFSKSEEIIFPCQNLPRLAESFSLSDRNGKPWFLSVSLRA